MIVKQNVENNALYSRFLAEAYNYLNTKKLLSEEDAKEGAFTSIHQYYKYIEHFLTGEKASYYALKLPLDEEALAIDANTREIKLPLSFERSSIVQSDKIAEILIFTIDRFIDNIDLANSDHIYIQWTAPDESGQPSRQHATPITLIDKESEPMKIKFGWPIDDLVTQYPGTVSFSVVFFQKHPDRADDVIFRLNTLPQTFRVKQALQPKINDDSELNKPDSAFHKAVRNSTYPGSEGPEPIQPQFRDPGLDLPAIKIIEQENNTRLIAQAIAGDGGTMHYEWFRCPKGARVMYKCEGGEYKGETGDIISQVDYDLITSSKSNLTQSAFYTFTKDVINVQYVLEDGSIETVNEKKGTEISADRYEAMKTPIVINEKNVSKDDVLSKENIYIFNADTTVTYAAFGTPGIIFKLVPEADRDTILNDNEDKAYASADESKLEKDDTGNLKAEQYYIKDPGKDVFGIHDGSSKKSVFEKYTVFDLPSGPIVGKYWVQATNKIDTKLSDPVSSLRCTLPSPEPVVIKEDLEALTVIEDTQYYISQQEISTNFSSSLINNLNALEQPLIYGICPEDRDKFEENNETWEMKNSSNVKVRQKELKIELNTPNPDLVYTWQIKETENGDYSTISGVSGQNCIVSKPGWYRVQMTETKNRVTENSYSIPCKAVYSPIAPIIDYDITAMENYLPSSEEDQFVYHAREGYCVVDSKSQQNVLLKFDIRIMDNDKDEKNNPLYSTKKTYTWYKQDPESSKETEVSFDKNNPNQLIVSSYEGGETVKTGMHYKCVVTNFIDDLQSQSVTAEFYVL